MKRKFLLYYVVTVLLGLIYLFEITNNRVYYYALLGLCILGGLVGLLLKKIFGKTLSVIAFGIITSWFVFYTICQYQVNNATEKIHSISKQQLIDFWKTNDYKYIPEAKRNVWVGFFPRKIKLIGRERVGWWHNGIFTYYNIADDEYEANYK